MARTAVETAFSSLIGKIGERDLAPKLLAQMGVSEFSNLNDHRWNHEWADYSGKLNTEWVAIAVRTRVNWQKPLPGTPPRIRDGFGGAGNLRADAAVRLIRDHQGLDPGVEVRLLWLAIAIDLDDTYEAYWGYLKEMRPRRTNNDHLTIRMKKDDRERYANHNRRLAWREPVSIPWEQFPGTWTCPARANYLRLDSFLDRDTRIEKAIKDVSLAS